MPTSRLNGALLPGLRARFPGAEIVFIGPEVARPLAEGLGARFVAAGYVRRGGLMERLLAWIPLRDAIRAEAAGLARGQWMLIDPDTRLTQLGLLAPGPEHAYRRLPSREVVGPATLAEIARTWLARALGAAPPPPAPLPLRPVDAAWSRRLRAALATAGRPVVAVGFGTGGASTKRIGGALRGGNGPARCSRGARASCCRAASTRPSAGRPGTSAPRSRRRASGSPICPRARCVEGMDGADVVTWAADAGAFLAAVAACDAHLGYDSAGGHVAAALGVPTLTAFVEASGPRHARRWTPSGPGPVHVVRLPPGVGEAAALHACRRRLDDPPRGSRSEVGAGEDRAEGAQIILDRSGIPTVRPVGTLGPLPVGPIRRFRRRALAPARRRRRGFWSRRTAAGRPHRAGSSRASQPMSRW